MRAVLKGTLVVGKQALRGFNVAQSWMESYDHFGQVNRVHPKMINGQTLDSIHYLPIRSELGVK